MLSALDVRPEAALLAPVNNCEYGDRAADCSDMIVVPGEVQRLLLPDVALSLDYINETILATTYFGVAIVQGDQVTRHFMDQTWKMERGCCQAVTVMPSPD